MKIILYQQCEKLGINFETSRSIIPIQIGRNVGYVFLVSFCSYDTAVKFLI